jgi:hypothetical protein
VKELTLEQFERDCALVLSVYGLEACYKLYDEKLLVSCRSYEDVCMYAVASERCLRDTPVYFIRARNFYNQQSGENE